MSALGDVVRVRETLVGSYKFMSTKNEPSNGLLAFLLMVSLERRYGVAAVDSRRRNSVSPCDDDDESLESRLKS